MGIAGPELRPRNLFWGASFCWGNASFWKCLLFENTSFWGMPPFGNVSFRKCLCPRRKPTRAASLIRDPPCPATSPTPGPSASHAPRLFYVQSALQPFPCAGRSASPRPAGRSLLPVKQTGGDTFRVPPPRRPEFRPRYSNPHSRLGSGPISSSSVPPPSSSEAGKRNDRSSFPLSVARCT